jgi:methylated-DNA-[protein]-cysteine S-methyltransferase
LFLIMSTTTYTRQDSAFGPLLLRAQHGTLTGLFFADRPHAPAIGLDWTRDNEADIFVQTLREVNEFAAGERHEFHVDAGLVGRPFQVQVWREIAAIPFGGQRGIDRLRGWAGSQKADPCIGTHHRKLPSRDGVKVQKAARRLISLTTYLPVAMT